MTYFTTFAKPRPLPKPRKALNKVSKKGDFWLFVSKVLNAFFLKINMPKVCEACHGAGYCGPLTPGHSRRRQDIRVGDWYYAFRVAVLGQQCHFEIDAKGRRAAEPIIEAIIIDRFAKLGLDDEQVKQLLIETAEQIQLKHPEYEHFVVTL
jgi:hypothetical protein